MVVARPGFDYLIVGAGFAGSVMAERLASQRDKSVVTRFAPVAAG